MTNWKERLAPGMPALRIGELRNLIGYSDETIRKQINAGAIETVSITQGGERRIPVGVALRLAEGLGVSVSA